MNAEQNNRSENKINKARQEQIQKDTLLRLLDITGSLSVEHLRKLFPSERDRTLLLRYMKNKLHLIYQDDIYYIKESLTKHIAYPDNQTISVFLEFAARAEYFTQATFPAQICFFVDHKEYEIIRCESGSETIVNKAASLVTEPPLRIVVVDDTSQIPSIRLQNIFAYATVNDNGKVQFFKAKESTS